MRRGADMGGRLGRGDRDAIEHYLTTVRRAGPRLDTGLAEAFEGLTPAQLDVLVAGLVDAEPAPAGPAPARTKPARTKRRLGDVPRGLLTVGVATVASIGLAVVGIALGGPMGDDAPMATSTPAVDPDALDQSQLLYWDLYGDF